MVVVVDAGKRSNMQMITFVYGESPLNLTRKIHFFHRAKKLTLNLEDLVSLLLGVTAALIIMAKEHVNALKVLEIRLVGDHHHHSFAHTERPWQEPTVLYIYYLLTP